MFKLLYPKHFQVEKDSLYLTDDTNVAIFPQAGDDFMYLDLIDKGHYEVHGNSTSMEKSAGPLPSAQPVRFSFHRPPSAAAAYTSSSVPRSTPSKTFVR